MPELPEVEATRRLLEPAMRGASFERVTVRRANLRRPFPPDFAARLVGTTVIAVDRRAKHLAAGGCAGEGRVGGFDADVDGATDELQAAIPDQGAGEEPAFDEHLEAVADAEYEAAIGREAPHGAHDAREFRDGPDQAPYHPRREKLRGGRRRNT